MSRPNGDVSILTPVLLILLGGLIVYTLAQQYFAISRLDKTDQIACSFLVADSQTRRQQAVNSDRSLAAERVYIASTGQVIGLFKKPAPGQSAAQRAGSAAFKTYLVSGQTVWRINARVQQQNIALTRKLALKAAALARHLACTPTK